MNPMFLSHLQSMQTNSQNAQNPGLWVNGNRMPVQESLLGAAVRGIGKVAKFGYDLGNDLGNGMMNAANIAVSGSPLKRPARYGDAGPARPSPGLRPFDPQNSAFRPTEPQYPRRPGSHPDGGDADYIRPPGYRPRPSPGSRPDWAPDYPYPNPSPRPGFDPTKAPGSPSYTPGPGDPGYRPRLPGLINPKPKSPTDITVDDIINPNTGNVSLSTGEANKPGAVTLHPEGQNILNPPAKPKFDPKDYIRPRPDYNPGEGLRFRPRPKLPGFIGPDYGRPDPEDRTIGGPNDPYAPGGSKTRENKERMDYLLKKRANSGEPLGIIPLRADPNLMNRMY